MPLHHLFGSEENSSRSEPIQQRMPEAYLALNAEEAARHGLADGALVSLDVGGEPLRAPLRLSADLAPGLIGVPLGLPGVPAWIAGRCGQALQEVAQ